MKFQFDSISTFSYSFFLPASSERKLLFQIVVVLHEFTFTEKHCSFGRHKYLFVKTPGMGRGYWKASKMTIGMKLVFASAVCLTSRQSHARVKYLRPFVWFPFPIMLLMSFSCCYIASMAESALLYVKRRVYFIFLKLLLRKHGKKNII